MRLLVGLWQNLPGELQIYSASTDLVAGSELVGAMPQLRALPTNYPEFQIQIQI